MNKHSLEGEKVKQNSEQKFFEFMRELTIQNQQTLAKQGETLRQLVAKNQESEETEIQTL